MKNLLTIFITIATIASYGQDVKSWTEEDRDYLVKNLIRSRDELIAETNAVSQKQGTFKPSPDSWSVNEVVEHITRYEMLFDYDIARALMAGKKPELMNSARQDSTFVNFIMEEKPHYTLEYTKPYTYTVPIGLTDLAGLMKWFLKMRNESIEYVKTTPEDLRAYFRGTANLHQTYIYMFGHTDRHLRQLRKVKKNPAYPKQ